MVALSAAKVERVCQLVAEIGGDILTPKDARKASKKISQIGLILDDADDRLCGEYGEAIYE